MAEDTVPEILSVENLMNVNIIICETPMFEKGRQVVIALASTKEYIGDKIINIIVAAVIHKPAIICSCGGYKDNIFYCMKCGHRW